jgi:hypothetical protein
VSIETRDDAADAAAQLARLADGVHHLAQQFLVGDVVAARVARALDDLAAEAFDLVGAMPRKLSSSASPASSCSLSISSVLGRGSGLPCLVEVAEQLQAAVLQVLESRPRSLRWKPET